MTDRTPTSRAAQAPRSLVLHLGERTVSLELGRGATYRLLAGESDRVALMDQLLGSGEAALVPCDGGLIGNLKVWENLTLPLAWRAGTRTAEIEARARGILASLGIEGERFSRLCRALPERLPPFERRLAAFTRAMLAEPRIMVYDRLFEGLTRREADRAKHLDALFHDRLPSGTSVYLESDSRTDPVPVECEQDLG